MYICEVMYVTQILNSTHTHTQRPFAFNLNVKYKMYIYLFKQMCEVMAFKHTIKWNKERIFFDSKRTGE